MNIRTERHCDRTRLFYHMQSVIRKTIVILFVEGIFVCTEPQTLNPSNNLKAKLHIGT